MSDDSNLFREREPLTGDSQDFHYDVVELHGSRMLPLYEAKMLHHYDHRFATYENATQEQLNKGTLPRAARAQHEDPSFTVLPRYWVTESDVFRQLRDKSWERGWLLGWRDICRVTDERTFLNAMLPVAAVGHPFPLMLLSEPCRASMLNALMASLVFDYVTRQKIGGSHLTYGYVTQLPVLPPGELEPHANFINPRALELTYTAYDMEPFARDLGDTGAPFRWDEERRFLMRAELDALFFHLYGIKRDDVDYIMETFPIVKRKDIAAHGTYRTKDQILAIYDAMAAADSSGAEYLTLLDPAPGFGPRHPTRQTGVQS
jgi:hypothetical protein